ncbi:MAG: DUF350 domain-containing protein [Alphaproteobacteria bacterium]|nr:DUF350 domain-containing protein [Alphaproteobacteria bacterium]
MDLAGHLDQLLWTVIYAFFGMVTFALAFFVITKVTPFSIRHEIEEDHNSALAIIIGSLIIGLAIIIAASIAG